MKKGFTLIEMLAVISLIAIISGIVGLSISSISKTIKTRQKDNLLNSMLSAAQKYMNDTGLTRVYVDTLIKEGYVSSDRVKGDEQLIIDPTDKSKNLNCYYYSLEDGKISVNDPIYDEKGQCSLEIFLDSTLNIMYCVGDDCNDDSKYLHLVDASGPIWLRDSDVKLKAIVKDSKIITQEEVDANAVWTTLLAPDVSSKTPVYEVVVSNGFLEDKYTVRVVIDGTEYVTSQMVRIDPTPPIVNNLRLNDSKWSKEKYVYADIEDQGSGIDSYAISNKTHFADLYDGEWVKSRGKILNLNSNKNDNKISENGYFYLYIKDRAGNITQSSPIEVTKVDNRKPRCKIDGESTVWTNQNRVITLGCEDDETACDQSYIREQTFMQTARTSYVNEYRIKDIAGNETICKNIMANIYVDKTPPEVKNFKISLSRVDYGTVRIDYSFDIVENESGISAYCYTNRDDVNECSWIAISNTNKVVDFEMFENFYNLYNTDILPRYVFVKDKAGNISTSKSDTYIMCEQSEYTCSDCSADSGWGSTSCETVDFFFGVSCGYDDFESSDCCNSDCEIIDDEQNESDDNKCTGDPCADTSVTDTFRACSKCINGTRSCIQARTWYATCDASIICSQIAITTPDISCSE